MANVSNSVPKVFIATPIDMLCSNFVKIGRREIGEIVRCVPDKNKISSGSAKKRRKVNPIFG